MNNDFFEYLHSDMIINIISLLPVRTILSCKRVCKPWLKIIESREFVKAHFSKSVQGLATLVSGWEECIIFEFDDVLDLEHHELHFYRLTNFSLPFYGWITSSANGLVFLRDHHRPYDLYICNPITRDYIKLSRPQVLAGASLSTSYGFGVSKKTDLNKVVGIFQGRLINRKTRKLWKKPTRKTECHVYTLGTGSWRRIAPGASLEYCQRSPGAFLNGNLHWLMFDLDGLPWISCFDLETELFNTFSSPPILGKSKKHAGLSVLGDCLCLTDNTSNDEIVIWLMKEYGAEKSWTKEFVIYKIPDFAVSSGVVFTLKVFKDGDILMLWGIEFIFYYSQKDDTIDKIEMFDSGAYIGAVLYTPSLLSLVRFSKEEVSSF